MVSSIRFEVLQRSPFADGAPFGDRGGYETVQGRVHLTVDPTHPANAQAHDLGLAVRGADGVHVTSDFWLLQPADPAKANRRMLFELVNRGNKRALQFMNDAPASGNPHTAAHGGNGFLMRMGYTVAAVAWQADILPGDERMVLDVPVARRADGSRIEERIQVEFISDRPGTTCMPLSGKNNTHSYCSTSLRTDDATLVRRRYPGSAAEEVPRHAWMFAMTQGTAPLTASGGDLRAEEYGIIPSPRHLFLPGGFEPGWIYELTYTACDPLVLSLGFIAVRDAVDAFRRAVPGTPVNALPEKIYCWGRSQAGRTIRDFLYRGFNETTAGTRVFDAMLSHIAGGGKTSMHRFSNLVIAASRQYEDHLNPSDQFPFSYASSTDHLTGKTDAILKRPTTDPLVIHTQTASEYWNRRGSLVHTDTEGNDLPQPEQVRIYSWSSSQHWSDPLLKEPTRSICENFQNTVATSAFFRSILVLLDRWATDGVAPPPSLIPRAADGTLVPFEAWRESFPRIPGIVLPAAPNQLERVEYGAAFTDGGAIQLPVAVHHGEHYAVKVPATDSDGNDKAGLLAASVLAPLGTYTGWNLRRRGYGAGALHDFSGSYIPFPDSDEERNVTGDPRRSVLERYGDAAGYVRAAEAACADLVARGFLLKEDVTRIVVAATGWGRPRHVVTLPG